MDVEAALARLRREAGGIYSWSNGPGDTYAEHEHAHFKALVCTAGSIRFDLAGGRSIHLRAGDRMDLPPHTRHSATVGPGGCTCLEGRLE